MNPVMEAIARVEFEDGLRMEVLHRGVGTRGTKGQQPYQYFRKIVLTTLFCPANISRF